MVGGVVHQMRAVLTHPGLSLAGAGRRARLRWVRSWAGVLVRVRLDLAGAGPDGIELARLTGSARWSDRPYRLESGRPIWPGWAG